MPRHQNTPETRSLPVYRSGDFVACFGANEGDGLSFASDLMLDDVYQLASTALSERLGLYRSGGAFRVATDSKTGQCDTEIHLDCTVTLMDGKMRVTEILVLVEVDENGNAREIYLLPLAPLRQKIEYRLVRIDTETASQKLAQLACVSFTHDTKITLASGRQCPVQNLRPGDLVLTRDNGARPIKWIGQSTQRAFGAFAPIRIAAGTLNNSDNLVVSPDHRLFFYQRTDHLGAGRAELMIKSRYLVNGKSVTVSEGGFVDYFQLLFDSHQIIYAEGIAAESMLVDDTTAPLLEDGVIDNLSPIPPMHRELSELDVQAALLDRPDAVEVLRRASKG